MESGEQQRGGEWQQGGEEVERRRRAKQGGHGDTMRKIEGGGRSDEGVVNGR